MISDHVPLARHVRAHALCARKAKIIKNLFTIRRLACSVVHNSKDEAQQEGTIVATKQMLSSHTVPGTDVQVEIQIILPDRQLAKLLGDERGTGLWITRYEITRRPGSARFANYLSFERTHLADAKEIANELWSDTVQRRNAAAV